MLEVINKFPNYNFRQENEWLVIPAEGIVQIVSHLKNELMFRQLIDITSFKSANGVSKITYILRNLHANKIAYLLTICHGSIHSITGVYPNAELYECEIYEKFNITFINHPHLVKIFS